MTVILTVNDREVQAEEGLTILQACQQAGIEIPHLCYHEHLPIAGNCRMCLVEVEGMPKLVASCAMNIREGMVVRTATERVKKARRDVMKMLLINHPLDCPVCDQGGECDLQDLAWHYGPDRSVYTEKKRAVPDPDFGPLIDAHMTRCIHCLRCVRFSDTVAGVPELGVFGRGEDTVIDSVTNVLTSPLSGNLVDLCPVGALTAKPVALRYRPWELESTPSVDVFDAVGSHICVDSRGGEVIRVLPREAPGINGPWISDKARFACTGLSENRLLRAWVRESGMADAVNPETALDVIVPRLEGTSGSRIAAIAGGQTDCETLFVMRRLLDSLGSPHRDGRQGGSVCSRANRRHYLFNPGFSALDTTDAVLLVGCDLSRTAPVLEARLRRRHLAGGLSVGVVGRGPLPACDAVQLGTGPETLRRILEGADPFSDVLKAAKEPLVIVGPDALCRPDGSAVQALLHQLSQEVGAIREDRCGYAVLPETAACTGVMDMGFVPAEGGRDVSGILAAAENGEMDVVFLLGADEIDAGRLKNTFVVYLGTHGDRGAESADVVLPGAAYTEKAATWINAEGQAQRTRRAVCPPAEARADSEVLMDLAARLGRPVAETPEALTHLVPGELPGEEQETLPWVSLESAGAVIDSPFESVAENYYLSDPVCRASSAMQACAHRIGPEEGT